VLARGLATFSDSDLSPGVTVEEERVLRIILASEIKHLYYTLGDQSGIIDTSSLEILCLKQRNKRCLSSLVFSLL
jgi:hypothetical protein